MAFESTALEPWTTAGGTAARRGLLHRTAVVRRPCPDLRTTSSVQASVVFDAKGNSYTADMAGNVQARTEDGRLLWQSRLTGGISATPAVHPALPMLFVGTHLGFVYALDSHDGRTRWQKELSSRTDPRILSDLLYWPSPDAVVLNSWNERFLALGAETGAELFSWNAGVFPSGAASLDPAGCCHCLRAVPDVGVQWLKLSPQGQESVLVCQPEHPRGARRTLTTAAPVIDPARSVAYAVFNADRTCQVHAWSLKTEAPLWVAKLDHCVEATPAMTPDGELRLADLSGQVLGLATDGQLRFQRASGSEYLLAGGVCDAASTFFIGDPLGRVHAIESNGEGRVLLETPRAIQARPSFGPDGSLWLPSMGRTVHRLAG